MKLASSKVILTFLAALLALSAASILLPNPCPSLRTPFCKKPKVCGATYTFKRKAICVRNPPPPACICPKNLDPVCCRDTRIPLYSITLTQANSCLCRCFKGRALFKGKCENPPRKPVPCTKELNPTCCYISRFDLTFVAGNPCGCTKARGGLIVSKKICKLKKGLP
eukprot:IDg5405t1